MIEMLAIFVLPQVVAFLFLAFVYWLNPDGEWR